MSNNSIILKQRNWNLTNGQLLTILLFIFYPLGALPAILVGIYNRERYAFTLFALWLGLFAVLYAPVTDYYRHLQTYYFYKTITWNEFRQLVKLDVVLPHLSFIAAKLNIHFEYVRFLFTFIAMQTCFWIFNDITKTHQFLQRNKLYHFLFFITLCFCCNYFPLIIGLRSGLARALIMLSAYLLFFKDNRKKGYLCGVLGALTHFGFAPFVIGIFILHIFPVHFSKTKTLLLFVLSSILSVSALNYAIGLIGNDAIAMRLDAYVNGEWGEDVRSKQNMNGIILSYMSRLPFLPLLIYTIRERWQSRYVNVIAMGIIFLGLFMNFPVIQGRYINLLILIIFFFLLHSFQRTRFKVQCLRWTFLFGLLLFLTTLYSQRNMLTAGREYMWLYSPAFVILNNTFDQHWVIHHIDNEGIPY